MSKIFGEKLKNLRLKNGMYQSELAAELNVVRSFISMLENGVNEPTIDTVIKICEIFNTTPNYLLGYDDDETTATRDKSNTTTEKQYNIS